MFNLEGGAGMLSAGEIGLDSFCVSKTRFALFVRTRGQEGSLCHKSNLRATLPRLVV